MKTATIKVSTITDPPPPYTLTWSSPTNPGGCEDFHDRGLAVAEAERLARVGWNVTLTETRVTIGPECRVGLLDRKVRP